MASVKVGDRVRIADRELTLADMKSGLFYGYFRNLTGVIERLYDDDTVCVDVDIDSLPEEIADRHVEMQTAARDKWIAGLSQEQRGRLSEQDKQFKMSYKVVVAAADVLPGGKGPSKTAKKASKSDTIVEASETAKPAEGEQADAPKRLTAKELAAKEREFLKSRQAGEQNSASV